MSGGASLRQAEGAEGAAQQRAGGRGRQRREPHCLRKRLRRGAHVPRGRHLREFIFYFFAYLSCHGIFEKQGEGGEGEKEERRRDGGKKEARRRGAQRAAGGSAEKGLGQGRVRACAKEKKRGRDFPHSRLRFSASVSFDGATSFACLRKKKKGPFRPRD